VLASAKEPLLGTVALARLPSNQDENANQNHWSILRILHEIGLMQQRQIHGLTPLVTMPVQLAGFLSAALVSVKTIAVDVVNTVAGNVEAGARAGAPPKKRLFDSPVKPSRTQLGGVTPPEFTVVLTTSVDPALKLAWERQQSPKTFHSTVFQPCAKLSTLSAAIAMAGPAAVVSTTVSMSPAVPVSVAPCNWSAGKPGAGDEQLLIKQSFSPFASTEVHCGWGWQFIGGGVVGQLGPKLRSQYSMNTQGAGDSGLPHWFWLKTNCCQP
jgi:hypothetical protein